MVGVLDCREGGGVGRGGALVGKGWVLLWLGEFEVDVETEGAVLESVGCLCVGACVGAGLGAREGGLDDAAVGSGLGAGLGVRLGSGLGARGTVEGTGVVDALGSVVGGATRTATGVEEGCAV